MTKMYLQSFVTFTRTEVRGTYLGPVHMIPGQLIAPGQLTDPEVNFLLGARSDACNCSHEFLLAPGQLQEARYPLYNNG